MDPEPEPGYYLHILNILIGQVSFDGILDYSFSLILLAFSLGVSFLASGSEIAFFGLTKTDKEHFLQQQTAHSKRIIYMLGKPHQLLATILITNNFMNVLAVLISAYLLREFKLHPSIQVIVITAILLFIGEIFPKVFAARNRSLMVSALSGPLYVLMWIVKPLANLLTRTSNIIEKRIRLNHYDTSIEDIKSAIDIATEGDDSTEDHHMLKGIVNFGNIPVKSIMRARTDVISVGLDTPLSELIDLINQYGYSRLPVYDDNLDDVKGILHIKDLLPLLHDDQTKVQWQDKLRAAHFVPESKKIDDLFEELKTRRLHIAIVVDEFGGTQGIVTLEDIVEEIFGEIQDEFDSEDWVYTRISDTEYVFQGRIMLNDMKKIAGLDPEEFEEERGESDSLAGLLLEMYGRIPAMGKVIRHKNYEFIVESASKNRIHMIKMIIHPAQGMKAENGTIS